MNGATGRMQGPVWKVLDWLIPPALFVLGWMFIQVVEIRANRFTSDNLVEQLELIRQNTATVAAMQAQIKEWQVQQLRWLAHHGTNLDELERQLERHLDSNTPHKGGGR